MWYSRFDVQGLFVQCLQFLIVLLCCIHLNLQCINLEQLCALLEVILAFISL